MKLECRRTGHQPEPPDKRQAGRRLSRHIERWTLYSPPDPPFISIATLLLHGYMRERLVLLLQSLCLFGFWSFGAHDLLIIANIEGRWPFSHVDSSLDIMYRKGIRG